MNNKGRKGCSNFTPQENKLLMDLVAKYPDVTEVTGRASAVADRKEAWTNITRQYNKAATSGPRTWHQLKALYESLKREQKSEDSFNDNSKLMNRSLKQNNAKKRKRSESKEEESKVSSNSDSDDVGMEWDNDDLDDLSDLSSPETTGRIKSKNAEAYYKIKLRNAKIEQKLLIEKHKALNEIYRIKKELLKMKLGRLRSN